MTALDRIAAELAKPVIARVVTTYSDGATKAHETRSLGAAANWAIGERRKIDRDLIDRETGEIVRVISVTVETI